MREHSGSPGVVGLFTFLLAFCFLFASFLLLASCPFVVPAFSPFATLTEQFARAGASVRISFPRLLLHRTPHNSDFCSLPSLCHLHPTSPFTPFFTQPLPSPSPSPSTLSPACQPPLPQTQLEQHTLSSHSKEYHTERTRFPLMSSEHACASP